MSQGMKDASISGALSFMVWNLLLTNCHAIVIHSGSRNFPETYRNDGESHKRMSFLEALFLLKDTKHLSPNSMTASYCKLQPRKGDAHEQPCSEWHEDLFTQSS